MDSLGLVVDRLDALVDDRLLAGWVAGVRDRDGQQIRSGGRRGPGREAMTTDTPFAIASNTKPMGGALTLRLIEVGVLALENPIDEWLPELAHPRVLRAIDGPLEDTVPAREPITVGHLLGMTSGLGWVAEPGPLAEAMARGGLAPGPFAPRMTADAYAAALGGLPLADHPGASWRYHTSSDLLSVLLQRATGRSVTGLLTEHVTGPLGMDATGFVSDAERMATVLEPADGAGLTPFTVPEGEYTTRPRFESLATGLVSTAADQLTLLGSLVGSGPAVLSPDSLRDMRTDHLTDRQRLTAAGFLDGGSGWGRHVEVRPDGRFGWAGGLGTIGYADPATGRAAFLGTQVTVAAEGTQAAFDSFWSLFD